MTCYRPLEAWRIPGEPGVRFSFPDGEAPKGELLRVACGRCIGCRLDRSREWATRCMHEAHMHDENTFITLTYEDEHLPDGASLEPDDFTKFMKRFRRRIEPRRISYFMAGEYGEKGNRPHYHSCIFGYEFPDMYQEGFTKSGLPAYRSESLRELWGKGRVEIGFVTFESAAYVARYVCKKLDKKGQSDINPETGLKAYEVLDGETGEIISRYPEYGRMSRNPAIGRSWYEKYGGTDVEVTDSVTVGPRTIRPPKYYDRLREARDPDGFEAVKAERESKAKAGAEDKTRARLQDREKVKIAQVSQLKRGFE